MIKFEDLHEGDVIMWQYTEHTIGISLVGEIQESAGGKLFPLSYEMTNSREYHIISRETINHGHIRILDIMESPEAAKNKYPEYFI